MTTVCTVFMLQMSMLFMYMTPYNTLCTLSGNYEKLLLFASECLILATSVTNLVFFELSDGAHLPTTPTSSTI